MFDSKIVWHLWATISGVQVTTYQLQQLSAAYRSTVPPTLPVPVPVPVATLMVD